MRMTCYKAPLIVCAYQLQSGVLILFFTHQANLHSILFLKIVRRKELLPVFLAKFSHFF